MPGGLITSRPIQNETTGIDLQVPLYQEVRGAMMTGHVEYQIIVVTRLAAFKSPRHKPGDTVQLVVSKKYSDIDELHNRLTAQYPNIALPAMPRKALFVGESDIRERRAAFDELVKFIAKNPTLAACSEAMEFLGAKSTEADVKNKNGFTLFGEEPDEDEVNFFQDAGASAPRKGPVLVPEKPRKEEEEEEEEPYLGPLGDTKCRKKAKLPLQPKPERIVSLFGDGKPASTDLFHSKEGNLKLFEDQDLGKKVKLGGSLLLPTAYDQAKSSAGFGLDEDTDELFRVEDDFDKLLRVTKQMKDKPALDSKLKPAEKPPAFTLRVGTCPGNPPLAVDQLKDQMGILKYIQQNELDANNDEDLF